MKNIKKSQKDQIDFVRKKRGGKEKLKKREEREREPHNCSKQVNKEKEKRAPSVKD